MFSLTLLNSPTLFLYPCFVFLSRLFSFSPMIAFFTGIIKIRVNTLFYTIRPLSLNQRKHIFFCTHFLYLFMFSLALLNSPTLFLYPCLSFSLPGETTCEGSKQHLYKAPKVLSLACVGTWSSKVLVDRLCPYLPASTLSAKALCRIPVPSCVATLSR